MCLHITQTDPYSNYLNAVATNEYLLTSGKLMLDLSYAAQTVGGWGTQIKNSGDVQASRLSPNSEEGAHTTKPNPPRLRKTLATSAPDTTAGSIFLSQACLWL